jgi:hypothetical protein
MLEFTTTGRDWNQHGENWLRRVSQYHDAMRPLPPSEPLAREPLAREAVGEE